MWALVHVFLCEYVCEQENKSGGGVLGTVGHVPVLAEMDLTHNLWKQWEIETSTFVSLSI